MKERDRGIRVRDALAKCEIEDGADDSRDGPGGGHAGSTALPARSAGWDHREEAGLECGGGADDGGATSYDGCYD